MISFATFLLGIWLTGTTLFFSYALNPIFYSDLIGGIALTLIGCFWRKKHPSLKAWLIAAIGLWLNFAPLVFWTQSPAVYLNGSTAGVAALAIFLFSPMFPNMVANQGPSVPPGWSYNPSSYAQRVPVLVLAFVCWMISRYLAGYQLGYIDTVWDPFFKTGTIDVLTSEVSKAFPISDAGLGAFAYSMETISSFGSERRWRTNPWLVLLFGLLTIPLALTSIVLIILQPVAVGAWCTLCIINAILMLIPVAFAVDEVAATLQFLRHSKEKSFWRLLAEGGNCPEATEDLRSPSINHPLPSLLKASAWGISLPWNLALTILVGAWLMFAPGFFAMAKFAADAHHVLGALIIVVAAIACSEVIRSVRWVNIPLAALLAAAGFAWTSGPAFWHQLFLALTIGALCFRKGPLREKTRWQPHLPMPYTNSKK
jgi:uncharacterized membrane protein